MRRMDDLWEVAVCIPEELGDAAVACISDLSPAGFEQRTCDGRSVFLFYQPVDADNEGALLSRTMESLTALTGDVTVEIQQVSALDWVDRVQASMKPVRLGPIWVVPPWHAGEAPDGVAEVVIEPGLAFGTGYHESTRLALRAAIDVIRGEEIATALDVGCGTGVLAIATLKLGVATVYACDIDPAAVSSARCNADRNDVSGRLRVACSDAALLDEVAWPSSFPLVIANLTAPMILSRAESLKGATAPGGVLILSGLYRDLCERVAEIFGSDAWRVDRELSEGDWRALVCRRPS